MIITIIGSINGENREILEIVKRQIQELFYDVRDLEILSPLDDQGGSLFEIQRKFIDKIEKANLVCAISKPCTDGVEFGESTTYELALADYLHKRVMYIPILRNKL